MSLPVSDLDFQKSHTKFIIGNEDVIIISKGLHATNGIFYRITLTAGLNVFDERGGYRSIAQTSIDVYNYEILCLSGSIGSYSDPQIYIKGSGQQLYLYKFPFNELSQTEPLEGYAEIGAVLNFVWTSQYPSFDGRKTRFQKAHAKFIIGNPQGISIIDKGDTVTVKVEGVYVFDEIGGYRVVHSSSITLSNNEILCLSAAQGSYSDPKLYTKGAGETLYLYKFLFNGTTQLEALPGYAELGAVMNRVWTPYNPSFTEKVYDRFRDFEEKGLLMKRSDEHSPFRDKIPNFVKKWRNRREDINIVMLDGSISTDMGYSVKRTDEAYRPPCCTERNIPSFIEEKLRWKQQQYRRYDAKVENSPSSDPVFTEDFSGGTAVVTNKDKAWDWVYKDSNGNYIDPPVANYNGLTRILSGANPEVSYAFRSTWKRCDFVHRTDYLSSANLQITVLNASQQPVNGIIKVYIETSDTWIEANGHIFSAKETDEILAGSFQMTTSSGLITSTGLRKTIFQKRLKMLRTGTGENTISIRSTDGGRLCYWGIQYSNTEQMFNLIDYARGSHNIASLKVFESWAVDYWKPQLILYACNTINEGASCALPTSLDSPQTFAGKFKTFIDSLLIKPYQPEIIAYIQFCMRNQKLVDASDAVSSTFINGYGSATVFDYHDALFQTLQELPIASANAFYEFWNIAKRRSEYYGTSIYNEMHGAAGAASDSFTIDTTHLNEYGAMVGWRFLEKYFNF